MILNCVRIWIFNFIVNFIDISDDFMTNVLTVAGFGILPNSTVKRFYGLGLRRGAKLTLKYTAPLGCPIVVDVSGTLLSLRQEEFKQLVFVGS